MLRPWTKKEKNQVPILLRPPIAIDASFGLQRSYLPIVASSIDAPSEKTQEIFRGERIEKEQREKGEKNRGI